MSSQVAVAVSTGWLPLQSAYLYLLNRICCLVLIQTSGSRIELAHSELVLRHYYDISSAAMSDSPLSIAASITGLLTFVAAVVAGFYAHALIGLRDAIDAPAEISSALDKIYHLETETDMLNNAYYASKIRQPDREYGSGDFKYFQGLYVQSLGRMRTMDRELRRSAELIDIGENRHDRVSRMKTSAAWMASRARIQRDIEERKAESTRIFQIQLAMLSAYVAPTQYRLDLRAYSNLTANVLTQSTANWMSCPIIKITTTGNATSFYLNWAIYRSMLRPKPELLHPQIVTCTDSINSGMAKMPNLPPSPTLSASAADRTSALLTIPNHAEISATPLQYHLTPKASEEVTVIPLPVVPLQV
jgi:hypothetical protein